MKDILVITPTLGNRESLRKAIDSVRIIGGDRVEHIIVCPASCIDAIKQKYGEIKCLAEQEGKRGIYAALNHGFRTYGRNYKYITFINDDDYWLPNYKLLIDYMDNHKDIDMVYAKTSYINEQYIKIGIQTSFPYLSLFFPLLKKNVVMLTQQATLIKSRLFFDICGFDESYKLAADTKFWSQLSIRKNVKSHYINKECAAYMIQEGQLSSDHCTQRLEHEKLFKEINYHGFNTNIALILFRLYNLPIYVRRFLKGGIKNPFST
jgi:glycosyltransferase involved in cell wall biosynthesis